MKNKNTILSFSYSFCVNYIFVLGKNNLLML